jgi:site-specific DNA-methyltransferase (adenine-specific)
MSTIIWKKNNVSNRQSWGTFASPLSPAFPTAHEYILVFAKNTRRLMGKFETDLTKQEFIDWSLAMWELPKKSYNECGYIINSGIHPAPMPEDLIIRCIKMFSWIGAMVLDPFMGIGTVPRVCKKLNRKYIGIEMSPEYVKFAESRLRNMVISEPLFNEEDEKKIWPSEETEI